MAASDQHPLPRKLHGYAVPVSTAGNDDTSVIGIAPYDGVVASVTYIPKSTITGAATNNRTIAVVNKAQDGSGATSVASLSFGNGTNATAFDEKALTLSATAADLVVAKGDVLVFTSTHAGTGIADPGGVVVVSFARA